MDTNIASELLDTIVNAKRSLVLLRCDEAQPLLDLLRRHAIRTGQALYAWNGEAGLRSMRDAQSPVPSSQRFPDALRHIIQSAHFGIYFFAGHLPPFDAAVVPLLRQAARLNGEHARRVVLISADAELPAGIEVFELKHVSATARSRLRDGRWVNA